MPSPRLRWRPRWPSHTAKQDADRESIRQALARPEVSEIAAKTGVDMTRVAAAAETLTGADLERAAAAARQVNESLVGGASNVVISTTTIIIVAARRHPDHRRGRLRSVGGVTALSSLLVALTLNVPFLPQTPALCGGAAVAMVFRYYGDRHADVQQFAPLVDRRAGRHRQPRPRRSGPRSATGWPRP